MKTPNQIPLDKITFPLDNPTWQNWIPTWQGCGPWEIIDVNPPSNDNDNDRPLGRQTFILKISLTPYYSSSWDVTILLYESLETLKQLKNASESFVEAVGPPKMTSAKIQPIISFFGPSVQTLSPFSVSLKPINLKILPDGNIYYLKRHLRKWIQIQIRTNETDFNLQFKFLKLSLGSIPSKWRFPEHRITLRVGMCPSCSTSHWKHWND